MHIEVKVIYPEMERAEVSRWLRDVADTVDNFGTGDDIYSVVDLLDTGVKREFKIMEKKDD
jgi:hypothetical protein